MFAKFALDTLEQDFENFITEWVDILADKDYILAYRSVLQDESKGWSPKRMENIINGYGLEYVTGERKFEVTKPHEAIGKGNGFIVMWHYSEAAAITSEEPKRLAEIWYKLPLNGQWSDLTVTFELLQYSESMYLELGEIRAF